MTLLNVLLWPADLLKLMLDLFHMICIPGRGACIDGIMKNTFCIVLHSDSFEPISFNLAVVIDTTFCSVILV